MKSIDGNITAAIQIKTTTRNDIGEAVKTWTTVQSLIGFLDYASGDSKQTNFNTKIEESSHIFIANYVPLNSSIKEENSRLLIDGKTYDVMLIDDPMNLHYHWEIHLKFTGGQ